VTVSLFDIVLHVPSWMADGLCNEYVEQANDWFPERGQHDAEMRARAVCGRCLVRAECLAYALEMVEHDSPGIWGGTSARERRALRRTAIAADSVVQSPNRKRHASDGGHAKRHCLRR
jgi:Transcription factor WhiB